MKYAIALIIIVIFCSCEKEIVTEYRETPVAWHQHSELKPQEKYILNGAVINEELHLIGRGIFTRVDTANSAFSSIWLVYDYQDIKIPMSDILMLTAENDNKEGQIEFVYIPGLLEDGYNKANNFVKILDMDASFLKFDYFSQSQNIEFGSYNNDYQMLLPYLGNPGKYSFMLISFDININPNTSLTSDDRYINIEGSKIISIPKENQALANPFAVYSIGKDFIVSNGKLTAKIYSDGTYKVINDPQFYPIRFFELEETLYAVNAHSGIYSSTDSGENWRITYETDAFAGTFMYTVVNNRIILSKGSSIFEMRFNEDGFETVELENDILEGNYITSINALNNKVYISTLSGLFYRNISDFFTPKNTGE